MATAAERARKRDLGPDWREKLRDSLRLLAMRTMGALLIGIGFAQAIALATHNSVDPSFSTAKIPSTSVCSCPKNFLKVPN